MTWPQHSITLLLICAFAGLCSALPGSAVAQNRGEQQLFSVRAAIEEVRRSPFHATHGPEIPAMTPDEVRQPLSQVTTDTTDLSDSAVSGGSIFFYTLPVAAVIDAFAMAGADDREESLDLLLALGAIAAPALIAKLAGARTGSPWPDRPWASPLACYSSRRPTEPGFFWHPRFTLERPLFCRPLATGRGSTRAERVGLAGGPYV